MSSRVLNPLVDRAMGVVPRLPIKSETERMLSKNGDKTLQNWSANGLRRCYRIRYQCGRCGIYELLLAEQPICIQGECHYCRSIRIGIDGCWGATDKTLPHLGRPSAIKPGTDYTGNWGKLIKPKRKKIYNCEWCKKDFEVVEYRSKKPKYCSHKCWGERKSYVAEVTKNGR